MTTDTECVWFSYHLPSEAAPGVSFTLAADGPNWRLTIGEVCSIFGTHDQLARLVDDIANLTHVAPPVDAERKAYAS